MLAETVIVAFILTGSALVSAQGLQCDFETSMCGLTSDKHYSADWERVMANQTSIPTTGLPKPNGHFLLLKPHLSEKLPQYEGVIRTPAMTIGANWCLSLYYYINSPTGVKEGDVVFSVLQNSQEIPLFQVEDLKSSWQSKKVDLLNLSNQTLFIDALIMNDTISIAFDELNIGPCSTPAPPPATTTVINVTASNINESSTVAPNTTLTNPLTTVAPTTQTVPVTTATTMNMTSTQTTPVTSPSNTTSPNATVTSPDMSTATSPEMTNGTTSQMTQTTRNATTTAFTNNTATAPPKPTPSNNTGVTTAASGNWTTEERTTTPAKEQTTASGTSSVGVNLILATLAWILLPQY